MPFIITTGGSPTLGDMRTEVLAYGFDVNVYQTRITSWLNEAQSRIARRIDLRELRALYNFTTVAGTRDYPIPADFIRLDAVLDQTDSTFSLDPKPSEQLQDTTFRGRPEYYALASEGILLWPVADAAYSIEVRYYADVVTLVADSDTPQIPSRYADLMVSYALSRAYRSEDDSQMSQFYYQEFTRDLLEMAADRQAEIIQPRQVEGMFGPRGGWGDW